MSPEMKDFLRAFRGKERKAARWWATCLEKGGPADPREVGALHRTARDHRPARAVRGERPGPARRVRRECYLLSSLEFAGRCPSPYTPDPLPKGWAKAA